MLGNLTASQDKQVDEWQNLEVPVVESAPAGDTDVPVQEQQPASDDSDVPN